MPRLALMVFVSLLTLAGSVDTSFLKTAIRAVGN